MQLRAIAEVDAIGEQQFMWMQLGSSSWRGRSRWAVAEVEAFREQRQQLKCTKLLVLNDLFW